MYMCAFLRLMELLIVITEDYSASGNKGSLVMKAMKLESSEITPKLASICKQTRKRNMAQKPMPMFGTLYS